MLLAFICYMFSGNDKKRHICITTKYNNDDYEKKLEEDNSPFSPTYKTLPTKLRYKISTTIGCFPLDRFELEDITFREAYWYSWDYYAYNCNLWRDRFNKHNIKINHSAKRIDFMDDQAYEDFGELYYYETDEQSKEIQNKATPDINKDTDIKEWVRIMKLQYDSRSNVVQKRC